MCTPALSSVEFLRVLYLQSPQGAGCICFSDPRGSIPPFEREVCHEPQAGDLLLFPPWLALAVTVTPDTAGRRILLSFNYVDINNERCCRVPQATLPQD